jgi:hypothetical protein
MVSKINSAVHQVHKRGFDIQVKAIDNKAQDKIDSDLDFLKNRDVIQSISQDLSDQLSQGNVDVGGTKNTSIEYREAPFGLDLNDDADKKIMKDIVFKLKPEVAFENAIKNSYIINKVDGIDLLETRDTIYYGIQSHNVYVSGITCLPQVEYLYPGSLCLPNSLYPDFRDAPYGYIVHYFTIDELHNRFWRDFNGIDIDVIINGTTSSDGGLKGYVQGNSIQGRIPFSDFKKRTVEVLEIQIKSLDGIGIATDEDGNKRFVDDDTDEMIWGQNTYCFYWLKNTEYFFGKDKLGYGRRTHGREAFTNFSWDVYKSQELSPVELCIGENRLAQMAYIKLCRAIIMAAPSGKYIDMKFINNAVEGLLFDGKKQEEVAKDLLNMASENNIFIGNSAGMDGKNDGQFKPVIDVPGGLKDEVNGYLLVISQAIQNISRFTGINDEISGMNNNPDTLNFARKLNIAQGINAINYANVARESNFRSLFHTIAWHIQDAVEKGGVHKKAVEELIGKDRANNIDDLGTIKDHQFYFNVSLGMSQEELQQLNLSIQTMEQKGQLTRLERFIIDSTSTIKEAHLLLAAIEEKANRKQDAIRQEQMQYGQQIEQQKGQNLAQVEQVKTQGKKEELYTQGEVAAKLMNLGHELGLSDKQMELMVKRQLQNDRLKAGFTKNERSIQAKKEQEQAKETPITL